MEKRDVVSLAMVVGGVVGTLAMGIHIVVLEAERLPPSWWYLVLAGCVLLGLWGGFRLNPRNEK